MILRGSTKLFQSGLKGSTFSRNRSLSFQFVQHPDHRPWSCDGEKCIFISIYSKKIYFQTGNAEQSLIVVLDSLGNKQEDVVQDIMEYLSVEWETNPIIDRSKVVIEFLGRVLVNVDRFSSLES